MSKINDSLNDVQKPKKANPANSKVLKEVLVLLDEIHKRPEEIIKRRKEQGITSLDDLGKVRAFDQTYQFESGTQLKRFLGLLESAEKRIEEIRRQHVSLPIVVVRIAWQKHPQTVANRDTRRD